MPHKADTTVICQCGAMVCKYYMPKHLRTVKHERDMVGREHIEVAEHLKYKPRNKSKDIIKQITYISSARMQPARICNPHASATRTPRLYLRMLLQPAHSATRANQPAGHVVRLVSLRSTLRSFI